MYTLYGDGKHDDTAAIQELLDSGVSLVRLPAPAVHYCISAPLRLHSNQTLELGRTTTIRLLAQSNCFMAMNAEEDAHDIALIGGIWDANNMEQKANPISFGDTPWPSPHNDGDPDTPNRYGDYYRGSVLHFYRVTRLILRDLTVKDPVTYCVELGYIRHFTVENIFFDQNLGNPKPINMDGIHVDGGCRFGHIRNIQGTCYDDIVALNADDGCDGTIEDIEIDGVYGERALRGIRLLSMRSRVARISISNVFGTFFRNAIGLTYFYPRTGRRGVMEDVTIRNVCARHDRTMDGSTQYPFSLIWVDSDIDVDGLVIDGVARREELSYTETLRICPNAHITTLHLSNVRQRNLTGRPITLFKNEGTVDHLIFSAIDAGGDRAFENFGTIGTMREL